ncbi:MAG: response regulator [Bacteroidota bacterium]|nr:response regulator [Bacteroidota bacterium]
MAADSKHLLVVDDVAKNIQFLGAILRDEGYVVSVALNGEEALQRARSIQPDLILMDVMMPVMDGLESCRRRKQDPSTANIPVIFLSAKGSP